MNWVHRRKRGAHFAMASANLDDTPDRDCVAWRVWHVLAGNGALLSPEPPNSLGQMDFIKPSILDLAVTIIMLVAADRVLSMVAGSGPSSTPSLGRMKE